MLRDSMSRVEGRVLDIRKEKGPCFFIKKKKKKRNKAARIKETRQGGLISAPSLQEMITESRRRRELSWRERARPKAHEESEMLRDSMRRVKGG